MKVDGPTAGVRTVQRPGLWTDTDDLAEAIDFVFGPYEVGFGAASVGGFERGGRLLQKDLEPRQVANRLTPQTAFFGEAVVQFLGDGPDLLGLALEGCVAGSDILKIDTFAGCGLITERGEDLLTLSLEDLLDQPTEGSHSWRCRHLAAVAVGFAPERNAGLFLSQVQQEEYLGPKPRVAAIGVDGGARL